MQRCASCPGINACVPPDGPLDADCVFIGEAPGKDENKKGKPFVGKTGQEVDQGYLPIIGRRRSNVYITNAMKCLPPGNGKLNSKRAADIDMLYSCAETHLYPELRRAKPRVIVPMGAFACRAIDPDIDLELQHGIPLQTSWGTTFPMYHPAGGIHEPKKMLLIRQDWIRLGKFLKGKLRLPVDQFAGREQYAEVTDVDQLDGILSGRWGDTMAGDTEITRKRSPFCLTFSLDPGTGYLIREGRKDLLKVYQHHLDQWEAEILFHNWLFDMDVTRQMGLRFPKRRIVNTLAVAFHLGNIPQGLKALSYRHLGMTMRDFDDVVSPHSAPLVLEYYKNALLQDWPRPEEQLVRDDKTGKWKLYRPHSMKTKLKTFFTYYAKSPDTKDVYEAWTKNWKDEQEAIEAKCGEWPGKCITHVPFEDALYYACRDADALLRLWPILKRARTLVRRRPEHEWYEAA